MGKKHTNRVKNERITSVCLQISSFECCIRNLVSKVQSPVK